MAKVDFRKIYGKKEGLKRNLVSFI